MALSGRMLNLKNILKKARREFKLLPGMAVRLYLIGMEI
jgi:hypothetical protein